jgi:hypothetical protein
MYDDIATEYRVSSVPIFSIFNAYPHGASSYLLDSFIRVVCSTTCGVYACHIFEFEEWPIVFTCSGSHYRDEWVCCNINEAPAKLN